jgi:hypothetical protein
MDKVAHRAIGVPQAARQLNNHYYWRGLAAIATGVIASDEKLFKYGVNAYRDGIDEIDKRGAFPQEMARSERSIHYQSYALEPLVAIAEFGERQHIDLFGYTSPGGRTIADAIAFLGAAVADPSVVKPYTSDEQIIDADSRSFFATLEFYHRSFPDRTLPAAIMKGLSVTTFSAELGGNTTVIAGI